MSTQLSRQIKRIQLSILTIEQGINNINISIQAFNSGTQLLGIGTNISSIPTRAQIINYYAQELGITDLEDPQLFLEFKENLTNSLEFTIRKIESFKNLIDPVQERLNEILVYIDFGRQYIALYQILANLFRILIQGLYLALAPLTSLLANEAAGQKIGEIILKVKAWVEKVFERIDTWIKWVSNFIDRTMLEITRAIDSVYKFVDALIIKIRKLIDFINSLSIDLLKSLLGIIPKDKNQILEEYADEVDNDPDPEPDDDPPQNGDEEDITETISNNDGRGDLPPDYYEGINFNQITNLKFILEKQRNRNNQSDIEYRRDFIDSLPIRDIIEELYNASEQINNGINSLREEDSEYLSLLEEYGLVLSPTRTVEKVYSIDDQITSLEAAEAELRRREIQRLSNDNIRSDAEYEEYGRNRDNANVTYIRKNL
jgi:hypothetical protein